MAITRHSGVTHFASHRTDANGEHAHFEVDYQAVGRVYHAPGRDA